MAARIHSHGSCSWLNGHAKQVFKTRFKFSGVSLSTTEADRQVTHK